MRNLTEIFRRSSKRVACVEIGIDRVQLVVVAGKQNEILLLEEKELQLSQVKDLALWLSEQVEGNLGQEADTSYLVYLNNEDSLYEILRLPQITGKQLHEAILWELPQYVSWLEGTYAYDYRVVDKNKDRDYSAVALAVATKDALRYFQELTRLLPWKPLGLAVSNGNVESHRLKFMSCTYSQQEIEDYNERFASLLYQTQCFLEEGLPLRIKENRGILYNDFFPRICGGIGAALILVILGYSANLYYTNYKLEQRVTSLEQKILTLSTLAQQRKEALALEAKLKELRQKVPVQDPKQLSPGIVLPLITYALAQDTWLDRFSLEGMHDFSVEGRALQVESVQQLLWTLEKQERLKKLELKELQQLKGNLLGFTIGTPQEVNREQKKL